MQGKVKNLSLIIHQLNLIKRDITTHIFLYEAIPLWILFNNTQYWQVKKKTLVVKEKLQEPEVEKLSHFYMTLEWHLRKQKNKEKTHAFCRNKKKTNGLDDGGKKRKHTLQRAGIHEYIIILSVTFWISVTFYLIHEFINIIFSHHIVYLYESHTSNCTSTVAYCISRIEGG